MIRDNYSQQMKPCGKAKVPRAVQTILSKMPEAPIIVTARFFGEDRTIPRTAPHRLAYQNQPCMVAGWRRPESTGAVWMQRVLRLANTPEQSGRTAATPPSAQAL